MNGEFARYPKVELHLHLEGCLTPAEALRLARRHGSRLDPGRLHGLYRHADFPDFLRHFGALLDLFKTPEDLCWLLSRVRRRLARQGVIYAEVRVSPSVWERHGMDPVAGLAALVREAATPGTPVRLIVDAVRHWEGASIARDLDLACRFRREGVVAFGLGGDERAAPAAAFADLGNECRSRRMPLVPHAGEALGPEEVASALETLRPSRIGHGIAAARSATVLAEVAARGVHLEVCPTSNRRTGVVAPRERHPLAALWAGGASLSLGTDDPALFGATLCGELRWALRSAGWTRGDAARSQAMGARAAFIPRSGREELERRVRAGWS